MSNLLDFPPGRLPRNVLSPPHVVFAICNIEVVQELPPNIPFNAVLHFIPKLKEWLLPIPSIATLPKFLGGFALRSPYVGIDIRCDEVTALGLKWVIKRLLQASGRAHPKSLFLTPPSVGVAVTVFRTWIALELPIAGVANLLTHIQTRLMIGPPVANWGMNIIWQSFPYDSPVVREMGLNSLRSHLNQDYAPSDVAALLDWYYATDERRQFFNSIKQFFPDILTEREDSAKAKSEKARLMTTNMAESGRRKKRPSPIKTKAPYTAEAMLVLRKEGTAERVKLVREKDGTRKVSPKQSNERQREDTKALKTRLNRAPSVDSIRSVETVIWDPQEECTQTTNNGASDRKPPSLVVKLKTYAKAPEAMSNRTEGTRRGRQRSRTDPVPTLTAEELGEVNEALTFNPAPRRPRPNLSLTTAPRRRKSSEASVDRVSARTRSQSSAISSTPISTGDSITNSQQHDRVSEQLRLLELLKERREKTVRKHCGREGLEEAKKESVGRKMPFGHSPYRKSNTAQEAIDRRRDSTLSLGTKTGVVKAIAEAENEDEERRGGDAV